MIVLRTRNLSNLNKIINDNFNDNKLIEHEDTLRAFQISSFR